MSSSGTSTFIGYGYRLHYSDASALEAAGFGRVAHLPCIFDGRPGYHRLGSRFLIDRGLGVWNPASRGHGPSGNPPTPVSIRGMGSLLCNFLEWCDVRGIDPRECDYSDHVVGRYQLEMLKGIWSMSGEGLAPRTVNHRVDQACEYLTWLADKGLREPFFIPTKTVRVTGRSATSSVGHRSKTIQVRQGKVREPKRRLRMPKDEEVRLWLKRIENKYGEAAALMCELVLVTALRREEAACWRADTLPVDPADWEIVNPEAPRIDQAILVEVKYGCKGPFYGWDHGDKIGPKGIIRVPVEFAERLHSYWKKTRNTALKKWVATGRTIAAQRKLSTEAVHLFRDEETGDRIRDRQLYRLWTGVTLPYKGWSPHRGRDWWSCSVLLKELRRHEHLLKTGINAPHALLESASLDVIRLVIQPQLRHSSWQTCMTYLQWVADTLGFNISIRYQQSLDEDEQ